MFQVGDIVRLRYGHTPMQVIDTLANNRIRAKYCSKHPVTLDDFHKPFAALNCQTRHQIEFVLWTGEYPPLAYSTPKSTGSIMTKQFVPKRVRGGRTHIIGTQVGTALNGHPILEFGDGYIEAYPSSEIRPYQDRIIHVVSTKNVNYTCFYRIPDNAKLQEDDLIISDTGNIYRVMMDHVKRDVPVKGFFKGKKFITQNLT